MNPELMQMLLSYLPIIAVIVFFYLAIMLPEKKRKKKLYKPKFTANYKPGV